MGGECKTGKAGVGLQDLTPITPQGERGFLAGFPWAVLVLVWTASLIFWIPRILPGIDSLTFKAFLNICVRALTFSFLFYSIYHLTALIFVLLHKRSPKPVFPSLELDIPVGIIMTVCDDFKKQSAMTILEQDYSNFHLYICDDSSEPSIHAEIDGFRKSHPHKITVIRRSGRRGFKAGSLNDALKSGIIKEPLLLLVDADEELEPYHLRSLVAEFVSKRPAFLQASHQAPEHSATAFQQVLSPSVFVYWTVYEQARNRYGFPLFLGHGVLFPRTLVEELGGFDETTTSEDIEFSYKLAFDDQQRRGWVSHYTFAIEEVPRSLQHYQRRFCRWMKQDLILALRVVPKIFSRHVRLSLIERLDLIIKQLHIPMCALARPYVILLGILMLTYGEQFHAVHSSMDSIEKSLVICIGALMAFASALPALFLSPGGITRKISTAASSIWLFNTLAAASGLALYEFVIHPNKVEFITTNSAVDARDRSRIVRVIPELLLLVLAGFTHCFLLGAMALAVWGSQVDTRHQKDYSKYHCSGHICRGACSTLDSPGIYLSDIALRGFPLLTGG